MNADSTTPVTAWTVGRLLTSAVEFLTRRGIDEPRLSAEILLGHALECTRIQLYTRYEQVPDDARRARYRELVQKAAANTPIAYLVGFKEFFSLPFAVTPDVLIPRPETETLVERAVEWCRRRTAGRNSDAGALHLFDLGCGSGCVVIAALKQLPLARGLATDVSPAALDVARGNAERHAIGERLQFASADRFDLPGDVVPPGGFDVLLCNPPYVAESEMDRLPASVRDFEPRRALTPGGDGLEFYRAIGTRGADFLRPDGGVFVEIGAGQGPRVRELMTANGRLRHAGTFSTPPDPHERVMQFEKQP